MVSPLTEMFICISGKGGLLYCHALASNANHVSIQWLIQGQLMEGQVERDITTGKVTGTVKALESGEEDNLLLLSWAK